jgi:hypothetical protein
VTAGETAEGKRARAEPLTVIDSVAPPWDEKTVCYAIPALGCAWGSIVQARARCIEAMVLMASANPS